MMLDYYDTLITPEEAAELLGCGMNTIYKVLKSGKLKAHWIGSLGDNAKGKVIAKRKYTDVIPD